MKKILLDCGSHLGESVSKFRNMIPDISEYEIHMFEPNPYLFNQINENESFSGCIKNNACVTDYTGTIKLWGCVKNKESVGSTIEKSKSNFDGISEDDYVMIDCIDLVDYIKTKFNSNDFIILKLDVEGAEYSILEKLIETNVIDYVNKLFCEFHSVWLDPSFTERERKIKETIKIPIEYWDAL
jgi:FkbM family methyltransferase